MRAASGFGFGIRDLGFHRPPVLSRLGDVERAPVRRSPRNALDVRENSRTRYDPGVHTASSARFRCGRRRHGHADVDVMGLGIWENGGCTGRDPRVRHCSRPASPGRLKGPRPGRTEARIGCGADLLWSANLTCGSLLALASNPRGRSGPCVRRRDRDRLRLFLSALLV
jgi:hypothetical protein